MNYTRRKSDGDGEFISYFNRTFSEGVSVAISLINDDIIDGDFYLDDYLHTHHQDEVYYT